MASPSPAVLDMRTTESGTAPAAPAGAPRAAGRLAWLDALRGFAALVVAYFHLGIYVLPHGRDAAAGWLQLGPYGVLLFFVVSGYVIPMSLERYGSARQFWVGRVFRIYPAWLLTVAAVGCLFVLDLGRLSMWLAADPVSAVLGHATMLQDMLGLPSLTSVFWTLSYEMVFYVLVSALFILGWHGRCAWWAVGLAAVAAVGGRALPSGLLNEHLGRPVLAVLVTLGLVGTVAAYISGRRRAALVAAVVGLNVIALPALNGDAGDHVAHAVGSWQSLTFLAVMFSGTVVYAAQHGRLGRVPAAVTLGVVLVCLVIANWHHSPSPDQAPARAAQLRAETVGTTLMVAATFAAAYALRHRRVPRFAAWLGQISYSVYLLHTIVLFVLLPHLRGAKAWPLAAQLAVGVFYLAVVLAVSWLSYVLVERPGQRLGKRVSGMLDRRLGPDVSARSASRTRVPEAGEGSRASSAAVQPAPQLPAGPARG